MDHGRPRRGGRLRVAPRVEDLERRRPLTAAAAGLGGGDGLGDDGRFAECDDPVRRRRIRRTRPSRWCSPSIARRWTGSTPVPWPWAARRSCAAPPDAAAAAAGRTSSRSRSPRGFRPTPSSRMCWSSPTRPPRSPRATPSATASFRTHVIAVVTHGGLQDKSEKHGPAWELAMAASLRREGFDVVIPFNWVAESSDPGAAAQQGARLARMVLAAANRFPASEPGRPLLHRPQRGDGGQRPGDPPARDPDALPPSSRPGISP